MADPIVMTLTAQLRQAYTGGDDLPPAVEAAIADVDREIRRLHEQAGALMVDATRREERALKLAHDCDVHGEDLAHLDATVTRFWRDNQHLDEIRQSIVTQLILLAGGVDDAEINPATREMRRAVRAIVAGHRKALDVLHRKTWTPGCPSCPHCQQEDGPATLFDSPP